MAERARGAAEVAGDAADDPAARQPDPALVLAATPIGNLADASPRLAAELAAADVVAAEDTRSARRLAAGLGVRISGRLVSCYDAVEAHRAAELVAAIAGGARVLVVSDAGMPAVSDPGFRLVQAALAAGVPVTVLPGPSAVLAALAVSGLAVDRFCFEGFLPRRAGARAERLAELAGEPRTLVFFEAPHRLAATLRAMAAAFGVDRRAAVCRELTKRHEEVWRGPLGALADRAAEGARGEITLVVAGAAPAEPAERAGSGGPDIAARVAAAMAAGLSRRDAVAVVARETGLPRRAVYAAALATAPPPADD